MSEPRQLVITPQEKEQGRLLFCKQVTFIHGSTREDDLPAHRLPEIAFAGRSNVGKSSLLNALTNQKDLARTSQTPGRTRQLNFFNIDDKAVLVDLPGYGYAKASKKDIAGWTKLTRRYLLGRPQLKRAFVLIDSRHGLKDSDKEVMHLLDETAVSYQIILTKCDKSKKSEREVIISDILSQSLSYPAMFPEILETSSRDKDGIEIVRAKIATLVL